MQNADALPNNDNSIAESSALSYIMQINFNWFALCIPYAGNGNRSSSTSRSNCGSRSGFIFHFTIVVILVAALLQFLSRSCRRSCCCCCSGSSTPRSSSCNSAVVNSFPPFFVYTIWARMLFAVSWEILVPVCSSENASTSPLPLAFATFSIITSVCLWERARECACVCEYVLALIYRLLQRKPMKIVSQEFFNHTCTNTGTKSHAKESWETNVNLSVK